MDGKAIDQDPMKMQWWSIGMASIWIVNPTPKGSDRLWKMGLEDALLGADDEPNIKIQDARLSLVNAMLAGAVEATGLVEGKRIPIPALEWEDMDFFYDFRSDEGLVHRAVAASGVSYTDVRVSRAALLDIWPPEEEATATIVQMPADTSAQRAAIAEAVKALWNNKIPRGITNQKRDDAIIKFAGDKGLAVPSERTIRRFFSAL